MSRDPYPVMGPLGLGYAFLGGPLAWGIDLVTRYAPVELACDAVGGAFLGGVTAGTLLAALGAAGVGWLAWTRARRAQRGGVPGGGGPAGGGRGQSGAGEADAEGGALPAGPRPLESADEVALRRSRWMGLSGMVLGAFFALVIAAQGLPALLVDPCLRGP